MREILFRAKRVDNGEWVEGNLITGVFFRCGQDIPYILNADVADYDCFEDFGEENGIFEVMPETLCQYTGLLDKSGKRIWENDIVKTSKFGVDNGKGQNFAGFDVFSVRYDAGEFALFNHWRRFNLRNDKNYEVIGNVFDSPELLE